MATKYILLVFIYITPQPIYMKELPNPYSNIGRFEQFCTDTDALLPTPWATVASYSVVIMTSAGLKCPRKVTAKGAVKKSSLVCRDPAGRWRYPFDHHDIYARELSSRSKLRNCGAIKRPRSTVARIVPAATQRPCSGCHRTLNIVWSHVCNLLAGGTEFAIRVSNYKWESAMMSRQSMQIKG